MCRLESRIPPRQIRACLSYYTHTVSNVRQQYTQDESLWRIFFQMQLYTARNVSGAKFISNTNRTAFRIFRPPRVQLGDAADLA